MTLVRGLDEHDWALLNPAELTAQVEVRTPPFGQIGWFKVNFADSGFLDGCEQAALHTQAAASLIEAQGIDPKSLEARSIILERLTQTLSPFAQRCVYDLDSQVLDRATRCVPLDWEYSSFLS